MAPRQVKTNSEFVVFDTPSPYDNVMGKPLIFILKEAVTLYHYSIKFLTPHGVGEVKGNMELTDTCQLKAYSCHLRTLLGVHMVHVSDFELNSIDTWIKIEGGEPVEELERVQVCADNPSKELKVGRKLQPSTRSEIVAFLRQNLDVFAWDHGDMRRIDPEIAYHKLEKLLYNGFLREAKYPKWVANLVLVKKHNGDRRVCIDFTDLNKACPKDSFLLSRIDQMVDATAEHELLSFMDAYSGYNRYQCMAQIRNILRL
ncbi:uncharacterized protein LOC111406579 [Olea europaea var. sylvestris]|uniref:uncharacterized protein LOC111406579 n=1 Tax=Olea europaea var. sylvestris TaxID=158386 RepID=UPI000C1D4657|nr:uncharacterized protein LOC111406579 [Olea europaea var. sylvestris]